MRGTLTAIGFALALALVYAGSCWLWPFARCGVCSGNGRRSREDGRVFRLCWWCKGTGRRQRIGRRVWNRARALRRDATR